MQNRAKQALKAAAFSFISNISLAFIKGITGFFGNSYALIADAIESSSDAFSSLITLVGLKYAVKPSDENHPYGHGKIEPLLTFLIVGFLLFSAGLIIIESIEQIQTPHPTPAPYTLIVLGIIVFVKEGLFRFILFKSKKTKSNVLKADAWHHRSDAITSLAAFIGIAIALIGGEGYAAADDYAALVASGIIIMNAYFIFRPALGEILDEHVHHEFIASIRKHCSKIDGILATEKCFARKSGMHYHIDLHAIVDGKMTVQEGHDIAHRLKDYLMKQNPEIANVNIHIEPNDLKHRKQVSMNQNEP